MKQLPAIDKKSWGTFMAIGGLYGAALFVLGMMIAIEHSGFSIPLLLSLSPFSTFALPSNSVFRANNYLVLVGILYWPVTGIIFSKSNQQNNKYVFILVFLLILQYLFSLIGVLYLIDDDRSIGNPYTMKCLFWGILYFSGQIFVLRESLFLIGNIELKDLSHREIRCLSILSCLGIYIIGWFAANSTTFKSRWLVFLAWGAVITSVIGFLTTFLYSLWKRQERLRIIDMSLICFLLGLIVIVLPIWYCHLGEPGSQQIHYHALFEIGHIH